MSALLKIVLPCLREAVAEVAVVVPVYRTELTTIERISLCQCVSILNAHPIVVVAPDGLPLPPEIENLSTIRVIQFDARFFESINSYSRLLMSEEFYQCFLDYRYILIHQLDVFVFSDLLLQWCRRGYDYVGAPWPEMDPAAVWAARRCSLPRRALARFGIMPKRLVGNGGFSLRRVRSALAALKLLRPGMSGWNGNEDIFWSFYVRSYLPWFRIPNASIAQNFSFEQEPEERFVSNGRRIPFGCHAWDKHAPDFWRPFIEAQGHILPGCLSQTHDGSGQFE